MSNKIIEGTFEPIELWETKSGEVFTNKQLAEYRARKDGDSDLTTGGYPIGPSRVYHGHRRSSDGAIFIIHQVTYLGDERARKNVAEDLKFLNSIA